MKKIIFNSALSFTLLFAATTVNAQDMATAFIGPKKSTNYKVAAREGNILPLNEVNGHAARDFNKRYGTADNVVWVDGKTGPSVYFTVKGINMRSTYDKSGNREYTIKYYNEAEMSKELRHLVKSAYYDYAIDQVTEVQRKQSTFYLVKVQNDKEILTLKVIDGEIAPFEKMDKAK